MRLQEVPAPVPTNCSFYIKKRGSSAAGDLLLEKDESVPYQSMVDMKQYYIACLVPEGTDCLEP